MKIIESSSLNVGCFLGFEQGQYGDLFMCLTPARVLKRLYPEIKLIFLINKKYKDCAELFDLSDDIDEIIITDGYKQEFPSQIDIKNIGSKIPKNYFLFTCNPINTIPDWFNYWHQTEELCRMYKLPKPSEEEMNFKLNKPIVDSGEYVCISPFTSLECKSLSIDLILAIKDFCDSKGLELIQLSSDSCPKVDGVKKFNGNYYQSVLKMLGSKFLVTADTGMCWAASAFQHKTFGVYFREYNTMKMMLPFYSDKNKRSNYIIEPISCKNIVPKNPNMNYIEYVNRNDLNIENVIEKLRIYFK